MCTAENILFQSFSKLTLNFYCAYLAQITRKKETLNLKISRYVAKLGQFVCIPEALCH